MDNNIVYENDIITIGLIYSFLLSKGMKQMISFNSVKNYIKKVTYNLNMMGYEVISNNDNNPYKLCVDELNNVYYVLDFDLDLNSLKDKIFDKYDSNVIAATTLGGVINELDSVLYRNLPEVKEDNNKNDENVDLKEYINIIYNKNNIDIFLDRKK